MYEEERGIVILAVEETDIAPAVALCYSIKNNNPKEKVAIITNYKIAVECFDEVIEFPFAIDVKQTKYQLWQAYWATPFKYNLLIEAANLSNCQLEQTFDYLIDHYDLMITEQVYDFRLDLKDTLTEIYEKNKISPLNSNFIFFTKETENAICFFKMLDVYTKHFQIIYQQFLRKEDYQDTLDIDLIVSMVISHLDLNADVKPLHDLFKLVDMKYLPFNPNEEDWTKLINFWTNKNGTIKIQNFSFSGLMRYRNLDFINDDLLETLGNIYAERTK